MSDGSSEDGQPLMTTAQQDGAIGTEASAAAPAEPDPTDAVGFSYVSTHRKATRRRRKGAEVRETAEERHEHVISATVQYRKTLDEGRYGQSLDGANRLLRSCLPPLMRIFSYRLHSDLFSIVWYSNQQNHLSRPRTGQRKPISSASVGFATETTRTRLWLDRLRGAGR